jgi:hypothetical protein
MAFTQISTGISIINKGHPGSMAISLTNFTTSAASNIAAGSAVEIAGAYFLADADVTPNASSWTVITTATTAYLALTPSGSAGSQIISAAWVSTIPSWNITNQGWYTTTPSTIRIVASAFKLGETSYTDKYILSGKQNTVPNQIPNIKGFMSLSLTNFTTSGVSAIGSGSYIEIAGAYFTANTDITINASSWTAITTATNCYIAVTPVNIIANKIDSVIASYTSSTPEWNPTYGAWYASATSNIRIVGGMYKNGTSSYIKKYVMYGNQSGFSWVSS